MAYNFPWTDLHQLNLDSIIQTVQEITNKANDVLSTLDDKIKGKQDKLTAGKNITLKNNVISANIDTSGLSYNDLSDKPSIGDTTLQGALSVDDIGAAPTVHTHTAAQVTYTSTTYEVGTVGRAISTLQTTKANTATVTALTARVTANEDAITTKQETLVSGTNIKTINGESILGSGNIEIKGGSGGINGATIDENGLISFTQDGSTVFTLQLPIYDGGTE